MASPTPLLAPVTAATRDWIAIVLMLGESGKKDVRLHIDDIDGLAIATERHHHRHLNQKSYLTPAALSRRNYSCIRLDEMLEARGVLRQQSRKTSAKSNNVRAQKNYFRLTPKPAPSP